ncbi:MAG: serine kinase [Planctomycetota bacterium]|nr:MAG: serine kinase [Planctomycetota bacterium]
MKLSRIIEQLNLDIRNAQDQVHREVKRGYTSDLLSDVLANGEEGDVWITLQIHPNIVAIAGMKGLSGIVLINGRQPQEETIARAREENIPIMVSEMTAFEFSGRLYAMLSGTKNDEGI